MNNEGLFVYIFDFIDNARGRLATYSIDLSYYGILPYGRIFSPESHQIHHTKQLHNVS